MVRQLPIKLLVEIYMLPPIRAAYGAYHTFIFGHSSIHFLFLRNFTLRIVPHKKSIFYFLWKSNGPVRTSYGHQQNWAASKSFGGDFFLSSPKTDTRTMTIQALCDNVNKNTNTDGRTNQCCCCCIFFFFGSLSAVEFASIESTPIKMNMTFCVGEKFA